MDKEYKEFLKNNCCLKQWLDGRYTFEGQCVYGLLYLKIPEDCKCIEVYKLACEINIGEIYSLDKTMTKKEFKEVQQHLENQGFKFNRGSFNLDRGAGVFSGGINDKGELEDRIQLYYYFYKKEYLDELTISLPPLKQKGYK